MTAHDLQTNRQSLRRESARDRDRRVPHDRDVVAGLHPVDVGLHRLAFDLGDERLVDAEWRNLRYRQDEEFVALHEGAHAVIDLRALRLRPRDLRDGEPLAAIDLPADRLLAL